MLAFAVVSGIIGGMSRFERLERVSPVKKAFALAGVGALLFVGGKAVDHYDGSKDSAPADVAELAGGVLLAAGVIKGVSVFGENQLLKIRQEEAEDARRLTADLPRLKDSLDPTYILSHLDRRGHERGRTSVNDYWRVRGQLFGTRLAVRHGAPYITQVEAFHGDIQQVISDTADARQTFGASHDKTLAESKLTNLAQFLDDAAPIAFDPATDERTKDNPDCWYTYLSGQVGSEMTHRLIEHGPTGIPAEA